MAALKRTGCSHKYILSLAIIIQIVLGLVLSYECPREGFANIRNPENCSTYIACTNPSPTLMPCGVNTCYDEEKGWCDHCHLVPACNPEACLPLSEIRESPFRLYPGFCDKFYFCKEDGTFGGVANCAVGLWFHTNDQMCNTPWASTCNL